MVAEIPPPLEGITIPPNVSLAYNAITYQVIRGRALLDEEEIDPLRVKMAADDVEGIFDLLDGLARLEVPNAWLAQLTEVVDETLTALGCMADSIMDDVKSVLCYIV